MFMSDIIWPIVIRLIVFVICWSALLFGISVSRYSQWLSDNIVYIVITTFVLMVILGGWSFFTLKSYYAERGIEVDISFRAK